MERRLDAKGQGESTYNYVDDVLLFKIKNREYHKSIEFDNFVIDVDSENFITGIRVFDASKLFNIPKYGLLATKHFEFNAKAEDNLISIQLKFSVQLRNKTIVKQGQDFVRPVEVSLGDSRVSCTV